MIVRFIRVLMFAALVASSWQSTAADARVRSKSKSKPVISTPLPQLTATCAKVLHTGAFIGQLPLWTEGLHRLTIKNNNQGSAIVKVAYVNGETFAKFYVNANTQWTLEGIPDGDYTLSYVVGPTLAANCEDVLSAQAAKEYDGVQTFETTVESDGSRFTSVLELTLYSVEGGNIDSDPISLKEFNRN